jgi:hypothetical protein
MQYHRLFADANGESHWDTVTVTLAERTFAPPAQAIEISDPERTTQSMFLRLRAGWNEPIHPTPVRQTLICLAGRAEVTASDGEMRSIGKGDVWRMEDKHGKGHHTKVVSDGDFECLIVQYD